MSDEHRHCDALFADTERAVAATAWVTADAGFRAMADELEHHLTCEEQVLFPTFEQATGMRQGPTAVMRAEHERIRALIAEMAVNLENRDAQSWLGAADTLMILVQQHNMKEEQVLYPMTAQALGSGLGALLARLREWPAQGAAA